MKRHYAKSVNQYLLLTLVLGMLGLFPGSCKKFLDTKTDKTLVIPSTLNDAQALLDFYTEINGFFPSVGNESDDNFSLLLSYFNSQNIIRQNHYLWAQDALDETDWTYMYQIVLNANIAIETVDKQPSSLRNTLQANSIKGAAYFFRALGFFNVAEYYSSPYDSSKASILLGIPLRLSSEVGEVSSRTTMEQTWQQIVSDLKVGISLLPVTNQPLSRPSRVAAYAMLSQIYLDMDQFGLAGKYADSSLQLNHTLMDFNSLDTTTLYPFARFNPEVIFPSVTQYPGFFGPTRYLVDSLLYQSFDTNDLRRKLYFIKNGSTTVGFRGGYDGTVIPFNGIATDEVYLTRAECAARAGLKDSAMADLNRLLSTRWVTGTFVPFTASSAEEALEIVLTERRKELILRGRRWFDLRRLNKDPRFAITLTRVLNGITYTLPPNDPRYTFPIPLQVIALTGMHQNVR